MANRAWWWWAAAVSVIAAGVSPRAARADSGEGSAPLADDRTMIALAVALACADAPQAGEQAPSETAAAPASDGPEIELVATVHAKALKFDAVPETRVLIQGTGRRKTVWKTERVNLPMHPQPGVVYRDVAIRLTVASDIGEFAALLKEARRASAGIVLEQGALAAVPEPVALGSTEVNGVAPAGSTPAATSTPTPTPTSTPTAAPVPPPASKP